MDAEIVEDTGVEVTSYTTVRGYITDVQIYGLEAHTTNELVCLTVLPENGRKDVRCSVFDRRDIVRSFRRGEMVSFPLEEKYSREAPFAGRHPVFPKVALEDMKRHGELPVPRLHTSLVRKVLSYLPRPSPRF